MGFKTRSVTAQHVTEVEDRMAMAAMTVSCLNCESPSRGPNRETRSMEPAPYPIIWPIEFIREPGRGWAVSR